MTFMTGILFAATFSWGCERANQLKVTPLLRDYAISQGEPEEEIENALKKLFSYLYYQVIARSNNINNPFDVRVIQAHWIGNELLEKVKLSVVKQVFQERQSEYDKVVLAYVLEPLIKTGSAHHNTYARHNPRCSVAAKGKYLYHLGIKRIAATPQELKNLAKYGRK